MRPSETDRDSDSICALATAHGLGAISVIRISGTKAADITRKLAAFLPEQPESHRIYYGILHAPDTGLPVDEVLISYFQAGRSFTGETTCEISCHGSEAVVNEILRLLVAAGSRPAERGEFTYRAFMHGRIDLVQAESVLALIESRSARASRLALRQLQGEFSRKLNSVLERITWVLAQLEANIDFAAEDIVIAKTPELVRGLEEALTQIRELLAGYKQGKIIRNGYQIALVGRPNAGKSSLLNAIAGEERAIVTPVAGTTRDFVEAQIVCDGVRVTLVDTAGLRLTDDPVETIGVRRTLEKMKEVDAVFYVCDARAGMAADERVFAPQIPWEKTLVLMNKCDLAPEAGAPETAGELGNKYVSAVTGAGLDELLAWLRMRVRSEVGEDSTLVSNARHFRGLQDVAAGLENTLPLVLNEDSPDLIALELQAALKALYGILGLTYDDQAIDRVFAEFCLGK
jgi:tRNA modification GTPase